MKIGNQIEKATPIGTNRFGVRSAKPEGDLAESRKSPKEEHSHIRGAARKIASWRNGSRRLDEFELTKCIL